MHHSQLEYLIAVQKLQGEEIGAQGKKLAEQMNVSTGYVLKLTKAAEQKGYVRRGKARSVYITEAGIAAMQEYLLATQVMEQFFSESGLSDPEVKREALCSICAVRKTTRQALINAYKQ